MTGFFQSIITIVLFIADPGAPRDHPRARPLRHGPRRQGPRPRVRHRLPAAGEGPGVRGETVYTLNWLPIGGFVKLEGEDGTDPDDPRSFSHQGLPKQADDPHRRRRDERPPGLRHLHRDRLARLAAGRRPILRGPAGFAGGRGRPAARRGHRRGQRRALPVHHRSQRHHGPARSTPARRSPSTIADTAGAPAGRVASRSGRRPRSTPRRAPSASPAWTSPSRATSSGST